MTTVFLVYCGLAVIASPPEPLAAEFGHGLKAEEAQAGWISLFDGSTTFGWNGSEVRDSTLFGGRTTSVFGNCEIRLEITAGGAVHLGGKDFPVQPGVFSGRIEGPPRRTTGPYSWPTSWLPTVSSRPRPGLRMPRRGP